MERAERKSASGRQLANRRLARFAMGCLAFAVTLTTMSGMFKSVEEPGFLISLTIVVSSFLLGLGIFVLAEKAIDIGTVIEDSGNVGLGMVLIAAGLAIQLLVSSWFTAVSLGGTESQRAFKDDQLLKMSRSLDVKKENLSSARELVPLLYREANIMDIKARLEEAGSGTPRAGRGSVFTNYRQIGDVYRSTAQAINQAWDQVITEHKRGIEAIRKARSTVLDPSLSKRDADRILQSVSASVARTLDAMDESDPALIVNNTVADHIAIPERGITDHERQRLEIMNSGARNLMQGLHSEAENMTAARRTIDRVEFAPKSMNETVLLFANAVPFAWAFALGLEGIITSIVLWFLLAAKDDRNGAAGSTSEPVPSTPPAAPSLSRLRNHRRDIASM